MQHHSTESSAMVIIHKVKPVVSYWSLIKRFFPQTRLTDCQMGQALDEKINTLIHVKSND